MRRQERLIPIEQANRGVIGAAHPSRAPGDRIKNRLNVRRRAGDHTQDFTRRCLLLQRFFEFVEQSDILDRDDSLVGKRFEQLDLRRGKGAHLFAACTQCSNNFAFVAKGKE